MLFFNLCCVVYSNGVGLRVKQDSAGPVVHSPIMGQVPQEAGFEMETGVQEVYLEHFPD